ncbi:hypothetical protein LDL08_42060 [Nonomuraea glycinis]|uniref:Transcriptional regulator n=1 Tax=Nonomuraea glycinis TaxID=2047744 RepID=A0A918AEY9_9ACTN|nr:hypothetical protein [Nonomuraea glycinis]MCA2182769.1 hypothetical protein [Nonomuraea glycinis]GGP17228.1 hypothetical protein GCM10012278_84250 [Nonomuraea glycinis]
MAPKRAHPISNTALAAAINQAGWTHAAVARHVNDISAENGVRLYYDRSTIGHWLTGTIPRPEGICAAVEAFRRRLHNPGLTPAGLGWPDVPTVPGPTDDPWQGDPVARLTALGEDDMLDRRTMLTASAFSLAGYTVPARRPLISSPRAGAREAGTGDVARIRATTRHFGELEDLYGGGHARRSVAAYLVHDVAPLLHGTIGRARPDLFRATAELVYLAAYMAMDDGVNGLAMRYYIQAVRLADEAGDRTLRATALRSMAVQARQLGHNREALALADAAASSLDSRGPQRTLAWITGMRAEAHAGVADRRDALALLRRAEAQLERADSLPETEWTGNYRRESFEHQSGLVLTQLGDHAAAARHYTASMSTRRPIERRTRALIGLRAAHAHLLAGDVDQAAATVLDLGADVQSISSARVRHEVRQIRAGWQPYRSSAHVAAADRVIANN